MRTVLVLLLLIIAVSACADQFKLVCDFDKLAAFWSAEDGVSPSVRCVKGNAHSGEICLAVDAEEWNGGIRTTWAADLANVQLTSQSRFQFFIRGSKRLRTRAGQPHGHIIIIESGGGQNSGDSHWLLDFNGDVFGGDDWREVITAPVSEARNADWAKDADGKLDPVRAKRLVFLMQAEGGAGEFRPFTFYFDDLSISSTIQVKERVSEAINHSDPEQVRAVQRGFIGRKRDVGQTVTFSDVTGWRVIQFGKAEASFVRSQEEPLFGEPVGKLTYRGGEYVRLEPPKPVKLDKFNGILMWVFGNNWSWMPDPNTPQVLISLEITDASGEKHVIGFDRVNWKFWSMMHKCVRENIKDDERHTAFGGDFDGKLNFPAALTAIEIKGGTNKDYRSIYFDSIIFREESSNLPELKADLDNLPFPTTKDTILPSVFESPVENSLSREGDTFKFTAKSPAECLEYIYTPRTGTLSDLTAYINGKSFKPCDGAGPIMDGEALNANLVSAEKIGDRTVKTVWKTKDGLQYGLALTVKGKSLICDWDSDSRKITELSLGKAAGLSEYQLFNIPYLVMGWFTPTAVMYSNNAYCYTILDWYNTNASQFYGGTQRLSESTALYNGGAKYLTLTDCTRNQLRERQFITVSQRFEEVLPNIPNPPSPYKDVVGKYVYLHIQGRSLNRFQEWLKNWRLFKEYGIDYVRISQHEDAWSDADVACQGPQEFTMTLEAAPEIGDKQLIDYCREVKKLGWLVGLYSNYTDFSMLGKSWDERYVTKYSNGEWRRVWPPNFSLKPLKAVDMEEYYAPRVAEKFGTNTVYCDVHTAVPPWENVDYEAGTPGAGMLSTQFKAYGKLLMNERKAYNGPVFSEGWHHWFYAGLCDGNYGHMSLPEPENQPLLVDFDLHKIHPLAATVGMNPFWTWGEGHNQFLATSIAYGHMGHLPPADIATAARGYYMIQQLQSMYNMVPVESILYHASDGRMLDVSCALPIGANKENQVYVKYKNNLEIYANCNKEKRWVVAAKGKYYDLPPFGWLAAGPDILEYSADFDGRRVDFVDSPDYIYADAGENEFDFGSVVVSGSVIIRKDDKRGLKIIPVTAKDARIMVDSNNAKVTAYAGDDKELGPVTVEQKGKYVSIKFVPEARYYIIKK